MRDAALAISAPALVLPGVAQPELLRTEYDLQAAIALERELEISHVLSQILVRRGFADAAAARDYLNPRETYDPGRFAGIEFATSLIQGHLDAGSRIVVHGDYDVDGVCATAVMVRALRSLGGNVTWFLPDRREDGYGLSVSTVRRLCARGDALLVTVDCGITAVAEIDAAHRGGLDVVVSDHHAPRPDGQLPDCPVIHPAVCGYPCPELCGAAVAHKLAQALDAPSAEEDIELVALATVADLMPLQGENRYLVRNGLGALANTARPGLRALMAVSRVDPSAIDAHALSFRLAPRINAAGRIRRADAGLELLLTEDVDRAREIAEELDSVNAERRAVEQRIVWEAEAQVSELGPRSAYVLAADTWHPGVIGIVASRVVERHHRPAVLVAIDEDGLGHGSGRSIPGFDLLGALHSCAQHMDRYGGHRAAAGLTISADRLPAFRDAIERYAGSVLTPELLRPTERVDAVVSGSELGLALAEELELLEPCGMGNPSPRLLVPGARFGEPRTMGEGRHARFAVTSGGAIARAVAFGCDGKLAVAPGEPADATFRLERNVYNGAVEPRLVLRHAQPCDPSGIEVVGEPDDYLRAALQEFECALGPDDGLTPGAATGGRVLLDRRGESPLAIIADAAAAGGSVLAVCSDVPRRLGGLRARVGGFALTCHHAIACEPGITREFSQIVVLDPPSGPEAQARLSAGSGFTHLAWGQAELRFAQQIHELEYGLRTSLAAVFRSLRQRQRADGEELERLLRGDGQHSRPARLAGRLMRVLVELELVSLDRDLPALAIASAAQTMLERSSAYRVYTARYEDGRRYLSSANPRRRV